MLRPLRFLLLAWLATGCAKHRATAPTEMVDIVRFVFRYWEDPEVLPEAMDNLDAWLADNIDSEEAADGFRLDPLAASDVGTVDHPDAALSELIGALGAARSPFSLDDHAGHMVLRDQVFSNPNSYDHYVREVEGDEDGFLGGEGLVRTANDVQTTTLGITIPYVLLKDYRWVEGETSRSILARSWVERSYCNDGGGTCLRQTYSVDVFFEGGSSRETWRLTAAWNQIDSPIPLGEDTLVYTLAKGIQDVFKFTDEYLADH